MLKLKELIGSKKFKVLFFGCLGTICSALAGQLPMDQALMGCMGMIATYLVSQGIADVGKEKKVE